VSAVEAFEKLDIETEDPVIGSHQTDIVQAAQCRRSERCKREQA
jgi:hypothetical protein